MLEFSVLGPLEVRADGQPLALGGAKRRALLALLLVRANEVVSTDRLIELTREVCAEPDARELDALLATGEMVSTALLAMALRKLGRESRSYNALQLPIETTGAFGFESRLNAV